MISTAAFHIVKCNKRKACQFFFVDGKEFPSYLSGKIAILFVG